MLSYQRSGASQLMQAEPGCTTERRRGTRAATTPRKLPIASPGTKTRGRTKSTFPLSTSGPEPLRADRCASAAVGEGVARLRRKAEHERRRRVDRERRDRQCREREDPALAVADRLRAGDERALDLAARLDGDRVFRVQAALEGRLVRVDLDAVVGRELSALVVGRDDQE